MKVIARDTIGFVGLQVVSEWPMPRGLTSMDVISEMKIFDDDAPAVARVILERLAGQGKVTEELRAVCACVANLRQSS